MSYPHPEQLIVLGAGLHSAGNPKPETIERALSTFHYFDEFGASAVVFSGGYSIHEPETGGGSSEAKVMAEIAIDKGLPEDLVMLEEGSTSTYRNFINSEPFLSQQLTGVITHARHMRRALYVGRKVLDVPLVGVESLGLHREDGAFGRNARLAIAKAMLVGVAPGEIDKVTSRITAAETVLGTLGPLMRQSFRRLHNA
jgi:uncharacterized SAM-binding protein YcdF (DUF218 family)